MSFVLAIDSGRDRKGLLDQLTRELAGREFVVVPSCAEALDVIDRRVPDLVVFPVSMAAADETVLTHRLQNLPSDDPSRLALPMLSLDRPTAASARWFYWFRPAAIQTADDARAFTDGLREQLKAVLPLSVPVPSFVEAAFDRSAPPVDEILEPPYLDLHTIDLEPIQFEMPVSQEVVELSDADRPGVWSRAADLVARSRAALGVADGAAKPLKAALRTWVPRAAAAGIVLVAGVSARSYWLTFMPRLQEATRLAASATAQSAGANVSPAPTGGSLLVTSDPSGAVVVVDGQPRGLTPTTVEGLAPGTHAVTVKSTKGTVERSVVVSLGQTATVDASIYSGWLALFSPIEIQVFDGTRLLRLDDRNRVMLSPGPHDLRFSNRALGYEERRVVEMKPGEVTPLTVVPPKSTISVSTSVPAELWIDGTLVGETPVVDWPVEIGTREIVLRGAGEHRMTVTATVEPLRLEVDLSLPPRSGD